MPVLIDSDMLIEVTRGRDLSILQRWRELIEFEATVLCLQITVAEVWGGARPSDHEALENLFQVLTCVPIDRHTGRLAGDCLRKYARSHGVEIADAMIAAAAAINGATLWTRNRKHYPMTDLRFL